jgi:LmbE family N-acetylglucosaminyl deacetylase
MIDELLDPIRTCARRIVVVVAHPDDEVIGAGGQLHRWPFVHFIHVTNGSPASLEDAHRAGCATREEYARLRRAEFEAVLREIRVPANRSHCLAFEDQSAAFHLKEITAALRDHFQELRPELILTHPFEGGHPDHDATAFAVHLAAGTIPIIEMAGYHASGDRFCSGQFLNEKNVHVRNLSVFEQAQKRRLFACYRSQAQTLSLFGTEVEKFRTAPTYNFDQPPHPGRLHYEWYSWGMTSSLWSQLAQQAA